MHLKYTYLIMLRYRSMHTNVMIHKCFRSLTFIIKKGLAIIYQFHYNDVITDICLHLRISIHKPSSPVWPGTKKKTRKKIKR